MEAKLCIYCQTIKPLSSFNKQPTSKDKHANMCKKCKSLKDKDYHKFRKVIQ